MSGQVQEKSIGSAFVQALFVDRDYALAGFLCNYPLTVSHRNNTIICFDETDLERIFSGLAREDLFSVQLLREQGLSSCDDVATSLYTIYYPEVEIVAYVQLTVYLDKVRFLHLGTQNNSAQSNEEKDQAISVCEHTHSRLARSRLSEMDYVKLVSALRHTGFLYWEYLPLEDKGSLEVAALDNEPAYYANFTEIFSRFLNLTSESHQELIAMHEALYHGQNEVSALVTIINGEGNEELRKIRYSLIVHENDYVIAIGTCENINELKNLEKRYSIATAQAGLIVWNYDVKLKTLYIENNINNYFSSDKYPNVPDCLIENGLIHVDDIPEVLDFFQRIDQGEAFISMECRIRDFKTDTYLWYRIVGSVALDDEGYPNSVIGTTVNINTQKQAEEVYKKELQLAETEEASNFLTVIYSFTKKQIIRKKTKLAVFEDDDQTFEDVRNTLIQLCPNIEQKKELLDTLNIKHLILRAFRQETEQNISFNLMTEGGESIWAVMTVLLINNPVTNESFVKIMVKDDTADYIIKAYNKKITAVEYDYVMRVNYETGKLLHLISDESMSISTDIRFTHDYEKDMQIIAEKFVSEDEQEFFNETMKLKNIVKRLKEEGEFEFLARTKWLDGTMHIKRNHVFMFDENTHTFCMGGVDITNAHRQEKEKNDMLRQSLQMAREANKAKNSFLASMSHDIRTPMNAIIGMVNLAIEDEDNKEQVSESLKIIKSSSEHLLMLINDILEMSRLESGVIDQNKVPFNIAEECTNIADTFKGIVIQKKLQLNFEMQNIETEHIIADLSNFKRILTNLIGNAVKYTPKGGSIFFRVSQERNNNNNNARFVTYKFEVQDTGIGISKELLPKLFEPFSREQDKEIKKIEGTGLGLAIVKALVDLQGGAISVASEKGVGTTFTLHISYERAEQTVRSCPVKKVTTKDMDLKGKTVLLVEDHPINIMVASKMLEKINAKIIKAENGQIACDIFMNSKENEIDIIFMDLQMPVMDGLTAAKTIRASDHPNAKSVPIIATTANAFSEDVHNCLNVGMNAHLAKPISVENLNDVLRLVGMIC